MNPEFKAAMMDSKDLVSPEDGRDDMLRNDTPGQSGVKPVDQILQPESQAGSSENLEERKRKLQALRPLA